MISPQLNGLQNFFWLILKALVMKFKFQQPKKQKIQRRRIELRTSAVLKPRHNQLDHLCISLSLLQFNRYKSVKKQKSKQRHFLLHSIMHFDSTTRSKKNETKPKNNKKTCESTKEEFALGRKKERGIRFYKKKET